MRISIAVVAISVIAAVAANGEVSERDVELDLLQCETGSVPTRGIGFDDVALETSDSLSVEIQFINGRSGFFSDLGAFPWIPVGIWGTTPAGGQYPLSFGAAAHFGTIGDVSPDLLEVEPLLLLAGSGASFLYGGLMVEASNSSGVTLVVSKRLFNKGFHLHRFVFTRSTRFHSRPCPRDLRGALPPDRRADPCGAVDAEGG